MRAEPWNKGRNRWRQLHELAIGQTITLDGSTQRNVAPGVHRQSKLLGAKFTVRTVDIGVKIKRVV
jgi:hypothetical protein